MHQAARPSCRGHRIPHRTKFFAEEDRVSLRLRQVGCADRGKRNVRGGKRRRVIEAVADHEHPMAARFQLFDPRYAQRLAREAQIMNVLIYLVPMALALGLTGLAAFLWSLRAGQYEDLDGAALRVLSDEDVSDARRE